MNNLQEDNEVSFEAETNNIAEELIRNVVTLYQEAWNKNSEKHEIKFSMTITNHKVAMQDGNKACAYLRLDRSIRDKGPAKLVPNPEEGKPPILDEGWETKLLHQEVYFFRNLKEQVDPRALWKEQLYVNCLARLISAGLEYAELLQRLKPTKESMQKAAQPRTEAEETKERLDKIGLVQSAEMPKPLTPDDEAYREWAKQNSEYGR